MKSKIIWLILSCLMVLFLVLASCGTKTPTTTPSSSPTTTITTATRTIIPKTTATTTPTTTSSVETPQYGGTFTYRITRDYDIFDQIYQNLNWVGDYGAGFWYESLATQDYSIDRNVYDFKTAYVPLKYLKGRLAESWEIAPDFLSYTFHIRKGIYWHDIPPMNGRELTASDIEWSYNRQLGLGGFTKPTYFPVANFVDIVSVTATDKYTVVFKNSKPSFEMIRMLTDTTQNYIMPREAVEKWGDVRDWRYVIGTGPYMLKDHTTGTSLTSIRNPNYYRFDPKYPQNRLPYPNDVKTLIIPDEATALAAVRSGKLDLIQDIGWDKADNLKKGNPQLLHVTGPLNGPALSLMITKKPFDDIRVRRAMQMAIDLPTIAKTHYGGYVDGKPAGQVGIKGYYVPYDEWPQDVKDGYAYNPEGAKKLLAEAGYPNGFKSTCVIPNNADIDLFEILKSYLAAIGINMEIQVMDPAAQTAYIAAGKHEMCYFSTGGWLGTYPPVNALNTFYSQHYRTSYSGVKDAEFDKYQENLKNALYEDEMMEWSKKADMRCITMQWRVAVLPTVTFNVYQPWLHGYQGEFRMAYNTSPYLWIDQKLKKSMGH